jgi:UPF0271 protein
MALRMDFNSDLGESYSVYEYGEGEEVMQYISSANVACGWHGGDPLVMRRTVRLAKQRGVGIGAHPSYPDLLGFGRRVIPLTYEETRDYCVYQIGALWAFCKAEGVRLQHVKPHGALYNSLVKDPQNAKAVAEAMAEIDLNLIMLALPGSELDKAARAVGLRVAREAFADRAYNDDGTLVSRSIPGSVIGDPEVAAQRFVDFCKGRVITITGKELRLEVDSICLHSDTKGAARHAKAIFERCKKEGVQIVPMAELVK